MKQLGSNIYRNPFSSVIVRFGVCFLVVGVAYRLFSSSFMPVDDDATVLSLTKAPPPHHSAVNLDQHISKNEKCNIFIGDWVAEKCNIFIGDWIRDPDGPAYTNSSSCSTIEPPQNCMKNGRPDSDYVYWRWKPRDCSLPKLDPKKFLHTMRAKSLAFIGDSIMRNHIQSLLCILSQVEQAVEVYHDEQYKNRRWSFPSHRFTVSVVWAPFLAKALTFEDDDGVSSGIIRLYLDEPDKSWTDQLKDFDYAVIAGGKWFLKSAVYYENNTIVGCHSCHDDNITEIGFDYAYRKVLNSTFEFISQSNHKPYILFRTTTPDHFENGEWNTGGYCNRTGPFKANEIEIRDIDQIMRDVELEEFERVSSSGMSLKLFDTTLLSLMRPDGHPGVYRQFHPYDGKDKDAKIQNDCLHWCLPGPIDSWNDLMMEMLLRNQI